MADISITPGSVIASSSAQKLTGVAGTTIVQGKALYLDGSSQLQLCDANAASPAYVFAGIALTAGSVGQPVVYCPVDSGGLTLGATVATGTVLVTSGTAGGIAPSTDIVTGWFVTVLGVVTTGNKLILKPAESGVAAA